jgi:cell division protein FtsX
MKTMKTKLILFCIICLFTNSNAQNTYYWYNQQKVYLEPDSSKFFVKLKTSNLVSVKEKIQAQTGVENVSEVDGGGGVTH